MAQITSISLRQLFAKRVFSTFSSLRENQNGYPYMTLINKKGESQNVYFGKKSAEVIMDKYTEGSDLSRSEEMANASIVLAVNADGEARHKISLKGESEYASSSDLATLFGVEEPEAEFDLIAFKAGFTAAPVVPDPAEAVIPPATTQANSPAIKNRAKKTVN